MDELEGNLNDILSALPYNNCWAKRNVCFNTVTAEALLMHLGCAVLDAGWIAGIVCHSLVAGWTVSEREACSLAYEDCINAN